MKIFISIMTCAIMILLSCNACAQNQEKPLTPKERIEVVRAIGKELSNNYVFPDVAEKMTAHISKQNKKGHYKKITDPEIFANKLTEDLRSISHDKHIRVRFAPEGIARQKQAVSVADKQKLSQQNIERSKKTNFGFKEVKILDGNVGYLNLTRFEHTRIGGETATAAMRFLSNADAIIFDLRNNGGGNPTMIQLISSYLFDSEPVHLNNFYWRPKNLNTQTWTLPHVVGNRSPDVPVYVLTSSRTFSAAEEFSYNLKNLKRATLIGETTGGGAHPGGPVIATDRFMIGVPSGRAINPITKTNWEGVGVVPHIKVKSENALTTAHIKAIEALKEKSSDDESIYRYSWVLETLNANNNAVNIDKATLQSFVGSYGPRVVTVENGQLYYQRAKGGKYQLIPIAADKFQIKELSYFRIQFESTDDKVTAIIGLYDNGNTDRNLKD
jgi:hypothetical protein